MPVDDSLWFTRGQSAALVGMGERNFDLGVRPLLPASSIRGAGKSLRFNGPELVAAWYQNKVDKLKQVAMATDADPLLAAGDSPALERYRDEKAKLAKMDREEREKSHVKLADVEPLTIKLFGLLRAAVEDVQRQWGNDPAQRINEALDEMESGLLKLSDATSPDVDA